MFEMIRLKTTLVSTKKKLNFNFTHLQFSDFNSAKCAKRQNDGSPLNFCFISKMSKSCQILCDAS